MASSELSSMDMSQVHKDRLIDNYGTIIDQLQCIEDVLDFLAEKDVISVDSVQEIKAKDTHRNMARCLLSKLLQYSELAYQEFVKALEETQDSPQLFHLLQDDTTGHPHNTQPFLFGRAKEYYRKLQKFHSLKIAKVPQITRYHASLIIHEHKMDTEESRLGFKEHAVLASRSLGVPIEREQLFKPVTTSPKEVKTVLLVGSPGAGKTATVYDMLKGHTKGLLWQDDYYFVLFILLREIALFNPDSKMSLKDLIFSYFGPPDTDKERVWSYIERHQEQVLIILDGYDELQSKFTEPLSDADYPTSPYVLLDNLIQKNILPNSNLIITGRMHCVKQLEDRVDRIVELAPLTKDDLSKLVYSKLPSHHAETVLNFIFSNESIFALCSIPVNAMGLIEYVSWMAKGKEITPELPQTRASILLLLILNLIHKHNTTLKDKPNITPQEIFTRKADTLRKVFKMACDSFIDKTGPKQVFQEEDLARYGLSAEEIIASGLMTGHVTAMADQFWSVKKLLLAFLHNTFQEEMSAIYLVHEDPETLVSLAESNQGTYDMLVLLSLGVCADPACRPLLQILYPNHDLGAYDQLVAHLLQSAWNSPRRYLDDGELWSIAALGESLQYDMSADLVNHLGTPLNVLNMWDAKLTSAYNNSFLKVLENIPDCHKLSEVNIDSSLDSRDVSQLLGAKGYKGLTLGEDFTTDKLEGISQAINVSTGMTKLTLVGYADGLPSAIWDKFSVVSNNTVECLGLLSGLLRAEIPQTLCTSLHNFQSLHSLDLSANDLSCRDNVSPLDSLKTISTIKHLCLVSCSLCELCTQALVELIDSIGLLWLDISQNPIGDEGAAILSEGLMHSKCALSSLRSEKCGFTYHGMDKLFEGIGKGPRSLRGLLAGHDDFISCSYLHMLTMSSLTKLTLVYCNLSPKSICSLLHPLSINNSPIIFLELKGNDLSSDMTVNLLVETMRCNDRLRGLCVQNCYLTDSILHRMTGELSTNHKMKLLDISFNTGLTSQSIVELLMNSHVGYVAMHSIDLGREGWCKVAGAIKANSHIISCFVGDKGKEVDLHDFFQTMQSYPPDGTLRHLMVYGDRAKLAGPASALRQALPEQVSLSFNAHYSYHAIYVVSGVFYKEYPADHVAWLTWASTNLK